VTDAVNDIIQRGLDRIDAKDVEDDLGYMAPRGQLKGISAAMEERRWQYAIPDGVFSCAAAFDKILVWQIPEDNAAGDTYPGTSIVMPQTGKKRVRDETPRGVLCSGGLQALDVLHTNGHRLGDRVHFVKLAPYRRPCMVVDSKEIPVMILNVGDIVDNEDLQTRLNTGEMEVAWDEERERHFMLSKGVYLAHKPQQPWTPEDQP
jgi:hypothetical protein